MATKTKHVGTRRTQRLRKVHCAECGYLMYLSRQWIACALPNCPNPHCADHGQAMQCADPADAVECGLMALDELPRTVRTEVCRRNGWEDEIVRTNHGRRATSPRQCKHAGCSVFVKRGELYCADHAGDDMPF